jgi:Sodium:dicarboxylate symporter family
MSAGCLAGPLGLLAVLLLAAKGAAGVAGAAFVALAATLAAVGTVPVESVALILGIHRLMSQALTPTNLIGNGVATLVIAKWERALDERSRLRLFGRGPCGTIARNAVKCGLAPRPTGSLWLARKTDRPFAAFVDCVGGQPRKHRDSKKACPDDAEMRHRVGDACIHSVLITGFP